MFKARQIFSLRRSLRASWWGLLGLSLSCSVVEHDRATTTATTRAALSDGWVGTWSVSPQSSGTTFQQLTLRQIVHTSIAGSSARIQISNRFGNQAVQISDVHLAQRSSGSSIVANTDRGVTFAGQSSVTIAQGDVAVSDSIAFTVPALSDVVVSFYLPAGTGPATSHGQGTQTNYIAAGDVAGDTDWSGPQTTGSYYFLANLDVQNPAALGAVVTLGASITDGSGSSQNSNRRWPNDLAVRLVDAGRTVGVLNQGISGNQLLIDGSGQSALHRFDRDVVSQPGVRWVIFSDDPINDLGNGTPSADQLIAGLTQLISSAHAAGITFLCSTLTPFEGAGYWTSAGETGREAVNAFIRGPDSGCDGIVDQDTATHDPANPTKFLPAYDSGDHLHPNEAGLQAIADAVDLAFFTAASVDAGAIPDAGNVSDAGSQPDAGNRDASTGGNGAGGSAGAGGGVGAGGNAGAGNDGTGGAAGSLGTGGGVTSTGGAGGSSGGGASGGASNTGIDAGQTAGAGTTSDTGSKKSSSGCDCRVIGAPVKTGNGSGLLGTLACLGAAWARRRRKATRDQPN